MNDESLMPFGKYKNIRLANIPASYFFYLEPGMKEKAPNKRSLTEKLLLDYINDNRDVLNKQVNESRSGN
jgi:hypothetical protein